MRIGPSLFGSPATCWTGGSGSGCLVEQPAILRAVKAGPKADGGRECNERPGGQQGDDDLEGLRPETAGEGLERGSRAADPADTVGEEREADALHPPRERREPPDDLDRSRQDREREDGTGQQEQRARGRLGIRPRLLAGLDA